MEIALINEDIEEREKEDKYCSRDLKHCLGCFGISASICIIFDIVLIYFIKIEDSSNSN